jgi:hypothetical protein
MDYLFNFLIQDYQQVALYGIALYLIVLVTIKIDRFYCKTNNLQREVSGLHDETSGLRSDVSGLRTEVSGLDKRVSKVEILLAKIDLGFTLLNKALLGKSVIDVSCYSNDHSPRTVNALGEKLFQESGADNIFALAKDELILELESKAIRSMLELQGESLNVMLAHWDDPRLKLLQDFAYQHPTYNKTPLSYTDILFVIALKLRDAYHNKHPDL